MTDLYSHGLPNIGKTRAVGAVTWLPKRTDPIMGPKEIASGERIITLQTDCLMTNPETHQDPNKTLHDAYAEYWRSISEGSLELVGFFARQSLHGGYLGRRFGKSTASFRGALRSRMEFLATSQGNTTSVEKIFGNTGRATKLTLTEFFQFKDSKELRHQDIVAIDRFTGGAADGAKFDAMYADKPVLKTTLMLDKKDLQPGDEQLLAAAFRDVCEGRVTFGFGGSKGYGEATGELCDKGEEWLTQNLGQSASEPIGQPSPVVAVAEIGLLDGTVTIVLKPNGYADYLVKYAGTKRAEGQKVKETSCSLNLHKQPVVDSPVQFILVNNELTRIRRIGEQFEGVPTPFAATGANYGVAQRNDAFANPYYFLPLVDRSKFKDGDPIADAPPKGHSQYYADTYSGTIRVKLTTETPLLICERLTDSEARQDHKTYSMRVDDKGQPMLASSSVRGMLRSAYEAITNSRFGVFPIDVHSKKLEFRPLGSGQSRRPYQRSPLDLLPIRLRLRPAILCSEVSPADRVFGWVNPVPKSKSDTSKDPRAYKSALRIGPVECTKSVIVNEPITLAILAQPKPAQGRFYLGKKQGDGTVTVQQPHEWPRQTKEQAGYHDGNRISGPKVYPHHQQPIQSTAYAIERSNQNRSITGWVKPKVEFEFTLHVTNLSAFELGALLWLLSLEKDHFLRLGLGKPLGFGSVRAEIVSEGTCIATGKDWTACIGTTGLPASVEREPLRIAFKKTMLSENPKLLKAFDIVAKGFENLPIQYPNINGEIEHFKWFVENERTRKLSLPDLTSDPSLPKNPSHQ